MEASFSRTFVDGALGQTDRGGDGGTDNVGSRVGIAAVSSHGKAADTAARAVKRDLSHKTQAWTLVISTLV